MGLRFRRYIKVLPGVRLNLSKSGIGISAGIRGLRVGVDAKGRKYASAGIPGTGLSTRQYIGRAPYPAHARIAAGQPRDSFGSFGAFVVVLMALAIGAIVLFGVLAR